MYRLNYCQPGALPPFRAFALTARGGLVALPRVSLPSVAGPGLQALPPAEVEGWPSAILNAAYGAYTMETICGTKHCDCLPDSNNFDTPSYYRGAIAQTSSFWQTLSAVYTLRGATTMPLWRYHGCAANSFYVALQEVNLRRQRMPWAIMAEATFMKPATLAPRT